MIEGRYLGYNFGGREIHEAVDGGCIGTGDEAELRWLTVDVAHGQIACCTFAESLDLVAVEVINRE